MTLLNVTAMIAGYGGVLFLDGMPAGEIDDAMQEIELRALEGPPKGLARGAWTCAVATNLAMDQHRDRDAAGV